MCAQIIGKTLTRPASLRKRKLVIDAAQRVFLELGYGDAGMDRIAEEAEVSKRTVYNHFESKQELFSAVIMRLCQNVMPSAADAKSKQNWSQQDYLKWLAVNFLQRIYSSDQIELYRTIIAESRNFPDLGTRFFDGPVSDTERVIYDYLVSQVKIGALTIASPSTAASQFLGMLKSDMHMRLLMGKRKRIGSAEIEEIAQSTVDLFLNGARSR
jgi:TetR/AcrR family transcriptional repressor of mexJK operon